MNNLGSLQQNRRWLVWATGSVLTLIAASSPWFTVVASACQNMGGGC